MRTLSTRRGFTLLELLLTLVMLSIFMGAMQLLVRTAVRHTGSAVQRSAASRDHLALWALASRDLAHASMADIALPATNAVEFDRPIAEGPVCASHPDGVTMRTGHAGNNRLPVAGRDQLLLREMGPTGAWLRRGIVSVAVANCPDARPALRVSTDTPIPVVGFARVVEPIRVRSYPSGPTHAVGMESRLGVASIQPLAGPITSTGFQVSLLGQLLRVDFTRAPLSPLTVLHPLGPSP